LNAAKDISALSLSFFLHLYLATFPLQGNFQSGKTLQQTDKQINLKAKKGESLSLLPSSFSSSCRLTSLKLKFDLRGVMSIEQTTLAQLHNVWI